MRTPTLSDRVTLRALRNALDGRPVQESATELATLAGGDSVVMRRALARVRRAAADRPSRVAERAGAALELAMRRGAVSASV